MRNWRLEDQLWHNTDRHQGRARSDNFVLSVEHNMTRHLVGERSAILGKKYGFCECYISKNKCTYIGLANEDMFSGIIFISVEIEQ